MVKLVLGWVLEIEMIEMIKDEDDVSKKCRHEWINTEGRSQNTCEASQGTRRHHKGTTKCCDALQCKFRVHRKLHFQASLEKMGCKWSAQLISSFTLLKLVFLGCGGCQGKGWTVVLKGLNWLPVRCKVFSYGDLAFSPSVVLLSLCYYPRYSCSSADL